jgi:hypothetical protein
MIKSLGTDEDSMRGTKKIHRTLGSVDFQEEEREFVSL